MGVVYTFLLPLFLFIAALAVLSPLIGMLCLMAATLCAVVLFMPVRSMLRAEHNWLRVTGAVLIPILAIAALAFAGVAVISFTVAVEFYL